MSALIVVIATYGALVVTEVGLWWKQRPIPKQDRGLYQPDRDTGIVLTPGYDSSFDDGYGHGRIRINSRGDRDDEPRRDAANRLLLIGDSFTFGYLLDQSETIDKWIERDRPGTDAYNLGVSNYNLPNQLDALRRTRIQGRDVVYLFYGNDLRPPREDVVINGFQITRHYGRGDRRLTDKQMAAVARSFAEAETIRYRPPLRSLLLPEFRNLVRRAISAVGNNGSVVDLDFSPAQREQAIAAGVRYTLEMQTLARQRGMGFHVVIIPSIIEMRAGAHAGSVAEYMARLRTAGIKPVDLLPKLSVDNYWTHDIHFNPSGAKVAAKAIVEALPAVSGGR